MTRMQGIDVAVECPHESCVEIVRLKSDAMWSAPSREWSFRCPKCDRFISVRVTTPYFALTSEMDRQADLG